MHSEQQMLYDPNEQAINLPDATGEYACLILDFRQKRYVRTGQITSPEQNSYRHIWNEHGMLLYAKHYGFDPEAPSQESCITSKGHVTIDLFLRHISFTPSCHPYGETDQKRTLDALQIMNIEPNPANNYTISFNGSAILLGQLAKRRKTAKQLSAYQREVYERLITCSPIALDQFVEIARPRDFFHTYISIAPHTIESQRREDEIRFRHTIQQLISKKLVIQTRERMPKLYVKGTEQKMLF